MMDGRIGAIREALEIEGFGHVQIMKLRRQICVGLLWALPRCGRLARVAEGRQENLSDGPR